MFGEPRSGSPQSPSTGVLVSKTRGRVSIPPDAESVRPSAINWVSTYSPFTSELKSSSTSRHPSGVGSAPGVGRASVVGSTAGVGSIARVGSTAGVGSAAGVGSDPPKVGVAGVGSDPPG